MYLRFEVCDIQVIIQNNVYDLSHDLWCYMYIGFVGQGAYIYVLFSFGIYSPATRKFALSVNTHSE